ncbi:uncharacterized protein LOC123556820 [Mercenaria mercenaria]|uniref:uncharacterized protein LOC123556820 n=1 Tax=Mercenaria mercenaria TaxID=6596 RepID=UPI00234E59BB|nr:uncharacterized protein LOC123556820 [Mercenaria mercenaria]XP_053399113.1 uncharacterized protein LOC123556820 [Mercenaria mercenaria]XP_053399114.1 uncharacterized protein LOC123556820 [Mercenaria mercenaria]XP_053399115.1 uncharacterized protein LOC123556820 [Mercenaria mercenaria]
MIKYYKMMEVEQQLPWDAAIDAEDVEEGFQGFWEGLKQKLDEELTQAELKRVILLMKDKIGKEIMNRSEIENPSDLLNVLENNMLTEEALSTVEHVFNIMDHHPEYSDRSFGQIIRDYMIARKRFGCPNIIGREQEIHDAIKRLDSSRYKGIWIHGNGGLGKTLLANEICARLLYSRNRKIISVDLKQVTSTGDFLRRLLANFTVYIIPSDTESLTNELLHHLKTISKDTCILLDNIEDVFQSNREEVLHILRRCLDSPAYMPIKWIATSRMAIGADTEIKGMEQVELLPLERKSAETLLKLSLRPIELTEKQCQTLLDITGEVPLAIRLLASTVKSWEPQNVSDDMLKSFCNAQLQNVMKGCIEYSYKSLKESEKQQLRLLSVVETSQFGTEIVKAVLEIEEEETLSLMMKLTNRQIIQRVYTGQKDMQYCLHPLIFEYVHNLPKYDRFSEQAQNNFCKHMLQRMEPYIANVDRNYAEAVSKISTDRPLLKVLFHVLSKRENDENDLLSANKNRYLSKLQEILQMTRLEKEQLYKKITEQMKSNGRQHSFVFWKLEEIRMMVDCGLFSKAEEEISILETTLFNEISEDDTSVDLKGRFWYVRGRLCRCKQEKQLHTAIECFKKSLDIYQKIQNVPEAAIALNAIGNAYFDSGDYDNALLYHNEAADRLRKFSSGNIHPDIAVYEFNVGTIYLAKARQEISIYKCVTEDASKYFKQALKIFEDSMAKDVQMGADGMPRYGNKLSEKAKALFYLKQFKAAISDMKRSLEIKIAPFKTPDRNITLAYYNTGRTFLLWREEVKTDAENAKLLLKEAVLCFRHAEEEIRSDGRASLTGRDKSRFISLYKQIANEVKKDEAKIIKLFCERFERGVTFDSSASSESSTSSETASPSRQENSDTDEGIQSDDNINDGAAVSFAGISSVETQKTEAMQFEQDFFSKINTQLTGSEIRKRRRSSSSESD